MFICFGISIGICFYIFSMNLIMMIYDAILVIIYYAL